MQKNLMIKDYIEKLSSKEPIPGGGSVAALTGSLAASLTSMTFNLTIGKNSFKEYDENKKEVVYNSLNKVKEYNEELLQFMDKDGEAFLSLMEAFKLPKNTEEEKVKRSESIQKGYKNALEIPFYLAKKCIEIYKYVLIAGKYGNKNLISDTGMAAILLHSTVESALLNVKINLNGIKDEEYKNNIKSECETIMKQSCNMKSEIMSIVNFDIE